MPAPGAPSPDPAASPDPSRRRALKGMAGIGAGALVWTEPTIRGLARRPAYANAGSQRPFSVGSLIQPSLTPGSSFIVADSQFNGNIVFTLTELNFGTEFRLTAVRQDDNCPCAITGSGAPTLSDGFNTLTGTFPNPPGTYLEFLGTLTGTPTLVAPTGLQGTCG